jgi:hypothetical protein
MALRVRFALTPSWAKASEPEMTQGIMSSLRFAGRVDRPLARGSRRDPLFEALAVSVRPPPVLRWPDRPEAGGASG